MKGKHTFLQKRDCGSRYLNQKNTHSILSLAVAGPDCKCLYSDCLTIKVNKLIDNQK